MAITENRRNALHNDLARTLGPESADTLMEMLPPTGWADVATKHDLDALAALTRRDLEAHAAATRHDLEAHAAATRHDLDALRRDLGTHVDATAREFASLREWLDAKFDATATQSDLRQMIFAVLAFNLVLVGAVIGFA